MKKRLICLAFGVLLTLAACAPGGGNNQAADTGAGKKVTVWDWSDVYLDANKPAIQPVIDKFKKRYSAAELKIEPIPNDDIRTKLLAAAAAGNLPDVAYLDGQNMAEFVGAGLLMPLDNLIKQTSFDIKDFLPGVMPSLTFGGKVYGIPQDGDVRTLLYRTDYFTEAGVSAPPTNWTELQATATKLTVDSAGKHPGDAGFDVGKVTHWGFCMNGGNSEHTSMRALPWIWGLGGDFADSNGKPTLNGQVEVQTLTFMNSLVQAKVAPSNSYLNTKKEVASLIKAGSCAMAIVGSWEWNSDANFLGTPALKDKLGSAPIPLPTGAVTQQPYTAMGGGAWVIFKSTKVKDLAWEWVRDVTSSEHMMLIFTKGTANTPMRLSALKDPVFQSTPVNKSFALVLPNARARVVHPKYQVLSQAWRDAVANALGNKMSPKDALDQAQKKAESALS